MHVMKRALYGLTISAVTLDAAHAEALQVAAGSGDNASLAEIIVTAQKRSEKLSDVPMSITALSADQLARAGISQAADLTKVVPGFGYQQGAFGAPVFSIRGIGFYDNAIAVSPTVTTYVDQVALPYSVEARGATLDLERIEVLKGPQGTLFGMNSTGGAINFIAAKPTREFAAGADLTVARFNDLEGTAFVSGPLTDTIKARVAIQSEHSDGWQYSETRPGDSLGAKRFNNGRLLLDWDPSAAWSFEVAFSAWSDRSDTQAAQFQGFYPAVAVTPLTQFTANALNSSPIAPNNDRSADWDPGRSFAKNDNFYQGSLRANWQLPNDLTLTSITAYSQYRGSAPGDVDGSAFANFAVIAYKTYLSSFSQELRIGAVTGPLRWMLGGNYQSDVADEYQQSVNQGTNSQVGPFLFTRAGQVADQNAQTLSGFGSLDYEVTNALTLQGSARYTSQDRNFDGCFADAGVGPEGVSAATAFGFLWSVVSGRPTNIPPGGCATLNPATFTPELAHSALNESNVSWRLGAKWKLTADALVYANATRGYKSGSYSMVPAILASQFTPVTQESVLAYEVGFKQASASHKVELSGATFYYDYANKQLLGYVLTPFFGTLPELVNIPKSRVLGAELNLVALPVNGLRLTAGVTYVDSRVQENPLAPAVARNPFGIETSYVGESFPNTPRWQAVSDAEYTFPVGFKNLNGFVGGAVTQRGASYTGFGESPQFKLPHTVLVDLRMGVESSSGRWMAQAWGRNITNRYYWTNVTHLTDYLSRLSGMPATFGVTVSYRY